jgi:hypothetical protein
MPPLLVCRVLISRVDDSAYRLFIFINRIVWLARRCLCCGTGLFGVPVGVCVVVQYTVMYFSSAHCPDPLVVTKLSSMVQLVTSATVAYQPYTSLHNVPSSGCRSR